MPIRDHFRDCKALLVTSLAQVSSVSERLRSAPLLFARELYTSGTVTVTREHGTGRVRLAYYESHSYSWRTRTVLTGMPIDMQSDRKGKPAF